METFPCKTCHGTRRRYFRMKIDSKTIYYPMLCDQCNGTGYIDWLDNIVKQPLKFFLDDKVYEGYMKAIKRFPYKLSKYIQASFYIGFQPELRPYIRMVVKHYDEHGNETPID